MNIVDQVKKNIEDFNTPIYIAGHSPDEKDREKDTTGYKYLQRKMLRAIDFVYASKFTNKSKKNRVYINKSKFRVLVAEKFIDMNVSHFNFIPDSGEDVNLVFYFYRRFMKFAREHYFGKLLNKVRKDYVKYGTAVIKRVGEKIERTKLHSIMISQDAESMQDAIDSGGYVIETHRLPGWRIKYFKDWVIEDEKKLNLFSKYTVYEQHAMYRESDILEDGDEDEVTLGVAFVCEDLGGVLFKEKEEKLPYSEVHWDKEDGRWLGVSIIEDNLDNQKAGNMIENYRLRHLMWASKKIFQRLGDSAYKDMALEMKDGQLIEFDDKGGLASQLNVSNQHTAEFTAATNSWDDNSNKKAFTFETATGESLKSGTPFRSAVLMSNTVVQHFDLKRQDFGLFWKEAVMEQVIPIFEKDSLEETLALGANESGIDFIKEAIQKANYNSRILDFIASGQDFDSEQVKKEIDEQMIKSPYYYTEFKKLVQNPKYHLELDLTRESRDTDTEMDSLQNVYQRIIEKDPADPRAENLLNYMFALVGKGNNIQTIAGKGNEPQAAQQGKGGGALDELAALTQQGNAQVI